MANTNSGDCEMANEQGDMVLVLMQHVREMKRQETRSRWATGFLLLIFFATFLWLQVSVNATKDTPIQEQQADNRVAGVNAQFAHSTKPSVHLQISSKQNAVIVKQNESYVIQWIRQRGSKLYILTDSNTSLIIPRKGQYFLNLRVYYRIPEGYCKGKDLLPLYNSIMQYHSNYPDWRNVIENTETMHCENNWYQSVDLHRVVNLQANTEIKVRANANNYGLISLHTYFDVTCLGR
ncbi:uncharacterized protein LOC143518894 [Brachyhypopomus gauderio]|uniref:uncharacterized protein LOC143518894 n=1 Tax=Brachyhypopomus gauderio TaxID=698409 RepID=UPI004041721A